ncbi:MAG: hypothetical protein EOP56_15510 [Sphingobacteriales bacterium]|nr:MAG: hypothetical protein EOP56_15510 [Sphingobacteriales bacterium]
MKKILMILAVFGASYFTAEAQSKTKSSSSQNYKICLIGDQYQVCNPKSASKQTKGLGRKEATNDPTASLRMMDTYTHMGYNPVTGTGTARNSRLRVIVDEPDAPYQGKESLQNDGTKKNEVRNINYLDQSMVLPANDGGMPR